MDASATHLHVILFRAVIAALALFLSGCQTGPISSAALAPVSILAPVRVVQHGAAISRVAFYNDGARMLTGDNRGVICVWQTFGPRYLRSLDGHHDTIVDLVFTVQPNVAASCADLGDGTLRIWNIKSGKCIRTISSGSQMDTFLNLASDAKGELLAAGTYQPNIELYNLPNGKKQSPLLLPSSPTGVLGFRSTGEVIAAAIDSGSILIRDPRLKTGARTVELPTRKALLEAAYCADSDSLVAVDIEGNAWHWVTLRSNASPSKLEPQSTPVYQITFAKNGALFAVNSRTGAELFRPGISRPAARFGSNSGNLGIDDDGKRVAIPDFDGVRVYETDYWTEVARIATLQRTSSTSFASHRVIAIWDDAGGLATCTVP